MEAEEACKQEGEVALRELHRSSQFESCVDLGRHRFDSKREQSTRRGFLFLVLCG